MKPLELDNPLRNNPVLWLIWVLLGSAVIGGLATLAIATHRADRQLPPDYHWEGQNLDRDFERARYAARLEHHARLDPYNWFNFYDFWHSDRSEPVVAAGEPRRA